MKNHKKSLCLTVVIIMSLLTMFSISASAATTDDLVFTLNSDGTGYILTDTSDTINGAVVIPDTYNSLPVVAIGNSAFAGTQIASVEIPEGVVSIGREAFSNCDLLSTIKFPTTLNTVGREAFEGASNLKKVYIKDVTAWNNVAFDTYYGDDCSPFYYNASMYINDELATNLVFPEGITTVNQISWKYCDTYETVVFPNSLTLISAGAFFDCDGIEKLDLHSGITLLGDSAFYDCDSISLVTKASGDNYTVGASCFNSCDNLAVVDFGEGLTSIGNDSFAKCGLLSSIKFPTTLNTVGREAFEGASNLKKVYIKDVTAWNNVAFDTYYGDDCSPFYYNASMYINDELATNLVFPEGITTVNQISWKYCDSYLSVTFPTSLISIPEKAFTGCDTLSYVFYLGSEEDWADISILDTTITDLAIHYNATGHTASDWVIDIEPTCTENGLNYKECTVCGIVLETEEIEALGHDYADEYTVDVDPTYTSAGSKSRHCSRCDATTDVTEIEKLYYKSKDYTGLYKVDGVWRYVVHGELNDTYKGLVKYGSKWYYVVDGEVDFTYTGLAKRSGKWYYVKKGVVDFSYTGLAKYSGKWYYVEDGVKDSSYTGLCKYSGKWYYVNKGKVDFTYTGNVKYNGKTYKVVKGIKV